MRLTNKYKYIDKISEFLHISKRILKFKRTKWKYAKKNFLRRTRSPKLLQIYKYNVPKKWERVKKKFKTRIIANRYWLARYNHNKRKRNQLLGKHFITVDEKIKTFFFKHIFEIDFFLTHIYLTSSSNEAKKIIEAKKIYKNNFNKFKNFKLKKGDIICFNNQNYKFKNIKNKFISSEGINSFYEYDYYTQSFVILKNFANINKKDIYLNRVKFL